MAKMGKLFRKNFGTKLLGETKRKIEEIRSKRAGKKAFKRLTREIALQAKIEKEKERIRQLTSIKKKELELKKLKDTHKKSFGVIKGLKKLRERFE